MVAAGGCHNAVLPATETINIQIQCMEEDLDEYVQLSHWLITVLDY